MLQQVYHSRDMGKDEPFYEVLDEQGHKTGQVLGQSEVHKKQLWHEVANVWIINSRGEVLLQLRGPKVELAPNVWDVAVGTHLRPGEDPTVAAQRCLQTELGITITADNLSHLFNIQSANPVANGALHKVLGHVFLLKRDIDPSEITIDTKKISKLAWKPLMVLMGEVGGLDTAKQYFPRSGNYYPKLFDALQADIPLV
jgi:isopentenyldiphosphate isomerase